MALRFNPPPNWPAPPEGFEPPAGWQPDPAWGPAPEGWQIWVDDSAASAASAASGSGWEVVAGSWAEDWGLGLGWLDCSWGAGADSWGCAAACSACF